MRIVCLGDSFSRGFGVSADDCWVSLLNHIGVHTFINKGINGDTTGGMLSRFDKDVISENPRYVIIAGGINDFICNAEPKAIEGNLMSMTHRAFDAGIIPIVGIQLPCIPSIVRSDWKQLTDFNAVYQKNAQYRNWLLTFCNTFGIDFLDFFDDFLKYKKELPLESYFLDGLRLTPKGHEIIAQICSSYFRHHTFATY